MGDNARTVAETCDRWGLPVTCPSHDTDAIYEAMGHDKKKRGGMPRWVLPREIGVVEIVEGAARRGDVGAV